MNIPKNLIVVLLLPFTTFCFLCFIFYVLVSHVLDIFHMNSYHLRCLGQTTIDSNHAEVYICCYCQILEGGSIFQNKGGPMVCLYFFNVFSIRSLYALSHIFAWYRNLEGSVLNYKCLLNFYLMLKTFLCGNMLHYWWELLFNFCNFFNFINY